MPISSADSSEGNLNLADRAIKLIRIFGRRDAFKLALISGHKFESYWLKEPTFCSQCNDVIYLTGFGCKSCKLVSHKACMPSIGESKSVCVWNAESSSAPDLAKQQVKVRHKFAPKYFTTPKFCNHCGTCITGVFRSQGLQCGECKMTIHYDCEKLVPIACETFTTRKRFHKSRDDTTRGANGVSASSPFSDVIRIDHFELLREIGGGSFGKVYMARLKSQPDKLFAIKAVKKTNLCINSDPESVLTEKRVLDLGRECNFLTIAHCCFQTEARLYFIMEYVGGKNLFYHLNKVGKFPEERTRFHSAEIVLALKFLHEHKIIHRDLKLENVILDSQGHCKLVDYGLAKLLKADERTRTFCGTSYYMSPEMIKEQSYGYSVDWWALGVLMFEMLTGSLPFPFPVNAKHDDEIYRIVLHHDIQYQDEGPSLSPKSKTVLKGFLTKDPNHRLGSNIMEDCVSAVLEHEFFRFRDDNGAGWKHRWEEIRALRMRPPYIPSIEDLDDDDTGGARLTSISREQLQEIQPVEYKGFSYCSQSFKSIVDTQ